MQANRQSLAFLLATVFAVVALAGCSSAAEQGSASVYVRDAPSHDFEEIRVVFTKVAIHAAGEGDDDESDDENETSGNSTAGWVTLFEDAAGVEVDLLNTSASRAAFLGETELDAGRYTQIRMTVKEAYGVDNGTRVPITVSSGTVKIVHSFTVTAGNETRIILDIDLDRSLHQQGNGAWRMTPVIGKAYVHHLDDDESGDEAGDRRGRIEDVDDGTSES